MGTASLIFGVILIIIGMIFGAEALLFLPSGFDEEPVSATIVILILTIPFFVIGGLLLRKYDRDKKF